MGMMGARWAFIPFSPCSSSLFFSLVKLLCNCEDTTGPKNCLSSKASGSTIVAGAVDGTTGGACSRIGSTTITRHRQREATRGTMEGAAEDSPTTGEGEATAAAVSIRPLPLRHMQEEAAARRQTIRSRRKLRPPTTRSRRKSRWSGPWQTARARNPGIRLSKSEYSCVSFVTGERRGCRPAVAHSPESCLAFFAVASLLFCLHI